MTQRTNEDIIVQIKELIESHVKPSVAEHNGNIEFVSYADGHLQLELGGACSGCSGSTATLRYGVENMIKHFVPEVHTVDAHDGVSSVDPFYSDDFGYAHWDSIPIQEDRNEPDN
jgi:Fe-S cluster biogenesis protein NfuA